MPKKKVPKNSGKAPSIQFYFKDWLEDQKLKRLRKNVKGTWIDIICCSCDMPVTGVFFDEGIPLKKREILQLLTGNSRENYECLTKIIQKNILKKFDDGEYQGAYYVKRIYRDMKLRAVRQECGKLGGNPNLVNQNDNQNPTPSSSSSTSVKKKYELDSVEYRLASLLFSEIKKRKPDHEKPNLQKWAKSIDLMIRRDNRVPEKIEEVIIWCQQDTGDGSKWKGWQNNILSTAKLREKIDTLEFKMQEQAGGIRPPRDMKRNAEGLTPIQAVKKQREKKQREKKQRNE